MGGREGKRNRIEDKEMKQWDVSMTATGETDREKQDAERNEKERKARKVTD